VDYSGLMIWWLSIESQSHCKEQDLKLYSPCHVWVKVSLKGEEIVRDNTNLLSLRRRREEGWISAPRFHEDRFRLPVQARQTGGNDPGKARLYGAGIKRSGSDLYDPYKGLKTVN